MLSGNASYATALLYSCDDVASLPLLMASFELRKSKIDGLSACSNGLVTLRAFERLSVNRGDVSTGRPRKSEVAVRTDIFVINGKMLEGMVSKEPLLDADKPLLFDLSNTKLQ
ncbi:hypothetical protein CYMTET_15396 [Cymbomonas tetramitiformis]|uniref:Uncharacterized protein n=1 Tax=Cymbomonas tetramitiformis TaxID=36881 RepID=A0AAE0GEG2_9CHLO|nr:hypothetical protein CYMTET_15396 [Cymbomonas tetramitiformis]